MFQPQTESKELYLTYPQDKFIFCEDEFICIKGTWGCGKSLAGLWAADKECEERPNNLYLVVRKEWVDLRDSTIHDWNKWVGRPINGTRDVHYPNGSVLMFRHGDDLNSFKNITLGGCLMVQAEEMSEDDFWFLKGRLRGKEGTRILRLECNFDGHNWIFRLFDEQKIGTLINTNTFDNEANLPPDYIPGLKKLPKKLQERHLYGSDVEMEGIIWDEFSHAKNVVEPFYIPSGWDKIIGLDHGFTNPTAVLWAAIDWDGNIFIYDEYYAAGKVISYHSEQIKARKTDGNIKWLIDPSCMSKTQNKGNDLRSIADEYADNGLKFSPADNDELSGINRVNEYFKTGKLKISKNCFNAIREVENWKWRALRPGTLKNSPDEPMDKDNHTCDILKYIINSLPRTSEFKKEPLNPNSAWTNLLKTRKKKEDFVYG